LHRYDRETLCFYVREEPSHAVRSAKRKFHPGINSKIIEIAPGLPEVSDNAYSLLLERVVRAPVVQVVAQATDKHAQHLEIGKRVLHVASLQNTTATTTFTIILFRVRDPSRLSNVVAYHQNGEHDLGNVERVSPVVIRHVPVVAFHRDEESV